MTLVDGVIDDQTRILALEIFEKIFVLSLILNSLPEDDQRKRILSSRQKLQFRIIRHDENIFAGRGVVFDDVQYVGVQMNIVLLHEQTHSRQAAFG